jgi:hypothetical protein
MEVESMTIVENPIPLPARSSAEALNHGCFCRTLDAERLREEIERDASLQGLMQSISHTRPHLFSSTVVFITDAIEQRITATLEAIERVIALPAFQSRALSRAPAVAQHAFGPKGVCMGFDFHLAPDGPKLIEINTNAGGALLNAALARAQAACCEAMRWVFRPRARTEALEKTLFDMFMAEWHLQRGDAPLGLVAIVDHHPAAQYLAPEFALFQQLFQRHGVAAHIVDPSALKWHEGRLWHLGAPVDLVYNRLTDFYFTDPAHQALRQAYESGATVVTPHPHGHALYADKRNLIGLSQDDLLAAWGVSLADRSLLESAVPQTQLVTADRAEELWAARRQLFFKPVAGFGARAAYRGDKLTRRVWSEILAGDFVAQALVPPSERLIEVDGVLADLKFDIRAYTYSGKVQLLAARMYSGQTTNFRTQGGGFAPVIVVPLN